MTVTIESQTRISSGSVSLVWSSDLGGTPTFYVYLDGVLAYTTTSISGVFAVDEGTFIIIEVLDDADDVPAAVFPGRFSLGWQAIDDGAYYIVEEYVASVWTQRAKIIDRREPWFTWSSRWLEDVTTHQFRVTVTDQNGNDSSVTNLTALMVRNPDEPDVTYTYSDLGPDVTIAAA